MKLSNLKMRLQNGEQVIGTRMEGGQYFVQLTGDPEVIFDAQYKPTIDNTIQKVACGVHDNRTGSDAATTTSPGAGPGMF